MVADRVKSLRSGVPEPAKRQIKGTLRAVRTVTSPVRVLPDFLIVGAQRAGTTSLHEALAQHPSIGASDWKEVHYFDLNFGRGQSWYRSHFPTAATARLKRLRTGGFAAGESSPYYLYHPSVPERAASTVPDARIIVILRDPVSRAYSHYGHEVKRGVEPLSFEAALDAEPERLAGEESRLLADPLALSPAHQDFSYVGRGRYAEQIERWLRFFPREQILIVSSEQLFGDPAAVGAEVQSFVGVPVRTQTSYEHWNRIGQPAMEPHVRDRLTEEFREPNRRLYDLIGADLGWPA